MTSSAKPSPLLAREITYGDPLLAAQTLRDQDHLTLLESSLRRDSVGRYSFLACNPSQTLQQTDGIVYLDGRAQSGSALASLDQQLRLNRRPLVPHLPPFQGGWAGFIAYDFARSLEPRAQVPRFTPLGPELIMHAYSTCLAFDHSEERAWILSIQDEDSVDRLEALLQRPPAAMGSAVIENWSSNFSRESYEKAVAKIIEYILAGDIFQANISQCFSARVPQGFDALAFYAKLRKLNPATFSAFLDYGDIKFASSSPERLVKLDDRLVEARPIKGTRRRDCDPALDSALVAELTSSRKDRAENVMIVDLLRNDLSRVCAPGSVRVPILCGLESYAAVHHLTSVVTGELKAGVSATDLIAAVFPGGSITGAPKIRAMELIAETEQQSRGVYCGSIGYFGFNGQVDLNIAIRTAQFGDGQARFQGGGGITARSQPSAEYEETLAKVRPLMEAFAP